MMALKSSPERLLGDALPNRKRTVRVLIVDDSVVMRRLLTNMLSSISSVEVIGSARDGLDALKKLDLLQVDLVTLDVEMPGPNGIETLHNIRQKHPNVRVVMCSSLTAKGAAVTMDALLAGADDFVTKQSSGHMHTGAYDALQTDLAAVISRMFQLSPSAASRAPQESASQPAAQPVYKRESSKQRPQVLTIGISTGGPSLLAEILPELPASFPVPVVIVQHMPPFFTQLLAERLSRLCKLPVLEAQEGMEVKPGILLLAPGDFHMRVVRTSAGVFIRLDQKERENSCRPAVDVLFRSVADVYGAASLGVVLTGMGEDGMRGARVLRDKGAGILAQDQATSVVWGMPGAVVQAGLASAILPAKQIIPEVIRRIC